VAGLCAGFCLGAVFVVEFVVLVRRLVEGAAWGWLVLLGLRLVCGLVVLFWSPLGLVLFGQVGGLGFGLGTWSWLVSGGVVCCLCFFFDLYGGAVWLCLLRCGGWWWSAKSRACSWAWVLLRAIMHSIKHNLGEQCASVEPSSLVFQRVIPKPLSS